MHPGQWNPCIAKHKIARQVIMVQLTLQSLSPFCNHFTSEALVRNLLQSTHFVNVIINPTSCIQKFTNL
jgi:hypothetical protein